MADCIKSAGLKTFLIAKTGTPDPTYKPHFYGGPLQASPRVTLTLALTLDPTYKPHFYGGPLQASPRVTLLTLALTLTLTLTLSLALTLP